MSSSQKSTAEVTLSILARLWALGCLGLFLLFWIPVSAIVFYSIFGLQISVICVLLVTALIAYIASNVSKRKHQMWRCGACAATFPPAAFCPSCGAKLNPPVA